MPLLKPLVNKLPLAILLCVQIPVATLLAGDIIATQPSGPADSSPTAVPSQTASGSQSLPTADATLPPDAPAAPAAVTAQAAAILC